MVQLKQNNWSNLAVQSWRGSHGCGAIDGNDMHNFIVYLDIFFLLLMYLIFIGSHIIVLLCQLKKKNTHIHTHIIGDMLPHACTILLLNSRIKYIVGP